MKSCGLAALAGFLVTLAGCPSSNKLEPADPADAARLPETMVASTFDSGLTLTIGMPKGDIADPDGNPITLSTVPKEAGTPPSGYARAQQDDPAVSYAGDWTEVSSTGDYVGGTAVQSTDAGAQIRYTFDGTAVHWVGYRDTSSGIAEVYLDGMHMATVDSYSTLPLAHVVIYSATGLKQGSHTLAIQLDGRHNRMSGGSSVSVDAFDTQVSTSQTVQTDAVATGSGNFTRIEQNSPAVAYGGSWQTVSSSLLANYSGGSAAKSSAGGAQATLSFNGTSVRWIGYTDTLSGIADVLLDGVRVATIDSYSLLPASQVVLYSSGELPTSTHTLAIRAEGKHSLLALGSAVWVDAFDVEQPAPDTTSPSVSMTAPVNGATVSGNVTVSANASDDVGVAGVQFKLDGANLGNEDRSAPYSISWSSTAVSNGSHTLTAVARDAASNRTTSSPVTVTVNNQTQPPPDTTPPTVNMTAPANGATVSGTATVSASASDNVGVAGVQFQLDGANLGTEDTNTPYSLSWNTMSVTNGSHTLTAIARDAASNRTTSSPVTVTVSNSSPDTTPPTVSMTAPASGATVSGSVTVSANASDNVGVAGVQFQLDGANLGTEDTSAPYSVSWNSTTASNGSHALTAIARDAAGNRTTSSPVAVTVSNSNPDTTPPTVNMSAPADGATVSGSVTVSANASDNVGVTGVQFQLDGANLAAEDTSSPYSLSWNSANSPNGTHTLTAIARDAAGNRTTSGPVTVTVSNSSGDSTPPTVGMTAPANGATVSGSTIVSANASDNVGVAGVQFQLDGANLGAEDTNSPYSISWNTTTAANGSHSLRAVARDAAGNRTQSSSVTVTVSNSSGGTTTRVEQDNPAVVYAGTWVTASDSSVSGGTAAESNQANATATLTFTGTGVTWIGYKCSCSAGFAQVSVDGGAPTQVDNYSATTQPQAPVFSVSGLPSGTHTLKITVTGQFDPAGDTAYVVVDAFDVTN